MNSCWGIARIVNPLDLFVFVFTSILPELTKFQRQFANSTLRVASLSRLVAYGFLNLYDGSYDLLDRKTGISINENTVTRRYVSETVHDQLRILAAEGLEPVEHVVFAEIDDLNKHFGKVRNGRIVAGICVLRLMLLYRDRVIRDSIRLGLPRGGERKYLLLFGSWNFKLTQFIGHQKRLAKAAFMYKRLTIAYGTLCRESTPLIMSWEQENERDPTVEDLVMTNLFSMLQPAFEEFCKFCLPKPYLLFHLGKEKQIWVDYILWSNCLADFDT